MSIIQKLNKLPPIQYSNKTITCSRPIQWYTHIDLDLSPVIVGFLLHSILQFYKIKEYENLPHCEKRPSWTIKSQIITGNSFQKYNFFNSMYLLTSTACVPSPRGLRNLSCLQIASLNLKANEIKWPFQLH